MYARNPILLSTELYRCSCTYAEESRGGTYALCFSFFWQSEPARAPRAPPYPPPAAAPAGCVACCAWTWCWSPDLVLELWRPFGRLLQVGIVTGSCCIGLRPNTHTHVAVFPLRVSGGWLGVCGRVGFEKNKRSEKSMSVTDSAANPPAAAAGVLAPARSRIRWPTLRRVVREAHESTLVHAVRIRPGGDLDLILKREKGSSSSVEQPASSEPRAAQTVSRRKLRSRAGWGEGEARG